MILKDGDTYKGWTDIGVLRVPRRHAMGAERRSSNSGDGVHDGFYQVFIDPAGPPEERFKAVWTGEIDRARFDAFRKQHPDGWEPRALLHLDERQPGRLPPG